MTSPNSVIPSFRISPHGIGQKPRVQRLADQLNVTIHTMHAASATT
jgi:hypothetical protein